MQRLYQTHKNTAEFLLIYIREAHPDSVVYAQIGGEEVLRKIKQTDTLKRRRRVARICLNTLKLTLPAVVDDADNRVNAAYAGWPERLVIVDVEGKIAYNGAPGPWGFKPSEVEQWLEKHRR